MMSNADRLLEIIQELDTLAVQLRVDGQEGYAHLLNTASVDLMWLYKDMVEYEA